MHTILGASGQIGTELALALKTYHTDAIRVVSRQPQKINPSDSVLSANLTDASQTSAAIAGSEVVYLTAGLPMDTKRWVNQWPLIMQNVIKGCREHRAKLVFFDNTYMYPQTSEPQTEQTRFEPNGAKGRVRAQIANQLLAAMQAGEIEALICRAPEFYGPGKTQSITNATVNFQNVQSVSDDFVDSANRDYHLAETSPAIDMCADSTSWTVDIDGQSWAFDDPNVINAQGPFDAGADETYASDIIFMNNFD